MSGKTQGDKNERSPAEKANNIDILSKDKITSNELKPKYNRYQIRLLYKKIVKILCI